MVIRGFTGIGKTTNIMKSLDENNLRWIYIAPTHQVIEENIDRSNWHNYEYLHLLGKEKCCLRQEIKEIISTGIDISFICEECPYFKNLCKYDELYKKAYRDLPNIGIVHAHIDTFLHKFLDTPHDGHYIADYYDVIIIDENPIKCLLKEVSINSAQLYHLIQVLETIKSNKEEIQVIINLLKLLLYTPKKYPEIVRTPLNDFKKYEICKWISKHIYDAKEKSMIEKIPRMDIVPFLFDLFDNMDTSKITKMIYRLAPTVLCLSFFKRNNLLFNNRVICLDGTANRTVWEHMLGGSNVDFECFDYEYKKVIQFNKHRYPITSWKISDVSAKYICGIIDSISARKKRDVLLVGTKDVNKKAVSFLKNKNYQYAVYYNLRSLNSYWKKCDTVILLCEPNPPQDKINSCVGLSNWTESVWRLIFVQEEMLQAIGRIRANIDKLKDGSLREEVEVIIFPNTGLREAGYVEQTTMSMQNKKVDLMKVPSLLPEARVMSVDEYLAGNTNNLSEMTVTIIQDCPLTEIGIKEKYNIGINKVHYYIDYLTANGLIIKRKDIYYATRKGINLLSPEEKNRRGESTEGYTCKW